MSVTREELDAAYRRAIYRVEGYDLCIDCPHEGFDLWLGERGATHYALLTAYNPHSTLLPPAINAARHQTLLTHLHEMALTSSPAAAHDPHQEWPPETMVCLLDPPEDTPAALGVIYAQNAIVRGRRGGVPKLLWLVN